MKSIREFLLEESEVFTMYDPDILKKVVKTMKGHLASLGGSIVPDTDLRSLSARELQSLRNSLPKNFTDKTTLEERTRIWQIYIEQRYRYEEEKDKDLKDLSKSYAKFSADGVWDDGTLFPQVDSRVTRFIPTMFGLGGTTISGVVKKKPNGVYYVKTHNPNTGKGVQDRLTKAWQQ